MSDPLSETCVYCGSPDVLDDAWWCWGNPECGRLAELDEHYDHWHGLIYGVAW